jgi:glycosyltransferase involved in cell wall biosynthesis
VARPRVAIVSSHPIQYYVPWYRALAEQVDLDVFYCHRQNADGQAAAGFDVKFEWDIPLFGGYRHTFLPNISTRPGVEHFGGCNTPAIRSVIDREAFEAVIVHGWSLRSYWQAMTACWRTGTPVLVRGDSTLGMPRSPVWRLAKEAVYRAFIPRFDGYLVVGSRSREYLQHYGARPERCFDAPHAVDNGFFAGHARDLRARRGELRASFGVPEDAVVLLYVGRFIDRKRPDVFVEAVARAAAQDRRVVGVMVGDGPMKAAIVDAAQARQAPIRFAGFLNQSEIPRAYVAADLLVVPSAWETWGLVVNEAMACGTPAAVSDGVACAGDLVIPDVSGIVTPVGDVDALVAQVIRGVLEPDRLTALRAGAVTQVARFGLDAAVAGTVRAVATVGRTGRRALAA